MNVEYDLVFDVQTASMLRSWPAVVIPLVILVVSAGVLAASGRLSKASEYRWWQLGFAIAPPLMLSVVTGGSIYLEHRRYVSAYREGRTEYVEGVVEHFVPMPEDGHDNESFEVAGHRFEYAESHLTAGYNTTCGNGGPIGDGRRVRIWHVANTILRLELER